MTSAPTTDKRCPHCGRRLSGRFVSLAAKDIFVGWEDCDCEGAMRQLAEQAEEERQLRHRQEVQELLAHYRARGIPPIFLERREGCEEVYKAIRKTASSVLDGLRHGRSAYIVGGVGTRKTLAASTAARYAIDDGMGVTFTTASKVLDAVRGSYGTSKDSESVMAAYANANVLVLDDLGKESPTDWTLMKLFELVNARYENQRPLVITTQYRRSELIERLAKNGDYETAVAIASRLAEMCDTYDFSGPDRRLHG